MRIAVLDKESSQADLICQVLSAAGHACRTFRDEATLLESLQRGECDLLVADAAEVLHAARVMQPALPVLFVASRSEQSRINGAMDAGASDYLIMPIRRGELLTRVQVLLRRAYPDQEAPQLEQFGSYVFDIGSTRATMGGHPVELTQKEFELALLLFRHLGRPLSRAFIREAIWSREGKVPSRTVDTHVSRVRSKLGLRPENGFRLVPVYSYGYRLEQLPE